MAVAVDDLRHCAPAPALEGAALPHAPGHTPQRRPASGASVTRLRPPRTPRWRYLVRRLAVVAGAVLLCGAALAVAGAADAPGQRAPDAGAGAAAAPRPAVVGAVEDPAASVHGAPEHGAPVVAVEVVVVPEGGTVWEAVAPHAPDGVGLHEWAAVVLQANGLAADRVPAGTALVLPALP